MCMECRQYPCHPRCPNAPDPEPVYVCDECREGIFDGGKYLHLGNRRICWDCIDVMDKEDILDLFGVDADYA